MHYYSSIAFKYSVFFLFIGTTLSLKSQSLKWIETNKKTDWNVTNISLEKKAIEGAILPISRIEKPVLFKGWGTCFNEKGWDALKLLSKEQQEIILAQLFSPTGELRFSIGRFSMNANDYANDWYSCDEVSGDFQLKYFNIERDKKNLIPYIKAAQKYNPNLTFWISPWSPPSWMKINQYYSVISNSDYNELDPKKDYLLFEDHKIITDHLFPKTITVNDYFIQDRRYLSAYANYFCKFIEEYNKEGISINKVMFQNEPWSYTPYPGCAWTAEGIIKFNTEYLGPILKENHPEVELYLGTINTNHFEIIDQILSNPETSKYIKGIGLQWEGGQLLKPLREKYPRYTYVQTESECGWGSFDWNAAEHTFSLINYYLGNGCEEYTFWNAILADDGVSGWGWKQNALINVNSATKAATYTPEYTAVKHYTHFLSSDTHVLAVKEQGEDGIPVLVVLNEHREYVLFMGNFNDSEKMVSIPIGKRFLNVTLASHSLNTFLIDNKTVKKLGL